MWLHGVGKWDFKGWDGWEVPVPLRRCHGCHTVGLDVETGHFVEPNIGCESCHGPGGWHAKTLGFGRIHSSGDAQVCGQCHVRGRSSSGGHFFPTGYQPGDVLSELVGDEALYWFGWHIRRAPDPEGRGRPALLIGSLLHPVDGQAGVGVIDWYVWRGGQGTVTRGARRSDIK